MITSHQNQQIKDLRKLQDKKHRQRSGLFAAEGEDLVEAALDAGWQAEVLFCSPGADARFASTAQAVAVDARVLDGASALGSGSRVIGVFQQRWSAPSGAALSVYLDGVGDPGNVGTVIRSALAFADGPVILGPNCADPWSPKAVRATMGTIFSRPPARAGFEELAGTTVALDADAALSLREVQVRPPAVVCVGAERDGLSAAAVAGADVAVSIPMRAGGPESLNAATAASVALYELGTRLQTAVQPAAAGGDAAGNTVSDQNTVTEPAIIASAGDPPGETDA